MNIIEAYEIGVDTLAYIKAENEVQNGGLPYAAILMGTMFKYCRGVARIYCKGFKPELVCEPPFWNEFYKYIQNKNNKLYALIDTTEWIDKDPMKLLKRIKEERTQIDKTIEYHKRTKGGKNNRKKSYKVKRTNEIIIPDSNIIVKLIHPDSSKEIENIYGEQTHFSIFDNEKFRYEYDSENYRAIGSFNQPETAAKLIKLFDRIFNDPASKLII